MMAITVLIVDDSKLARIVAGKAIRVLQPDWRRVEANSAEDAIVKLAEHEIDIALLDYNMPGKNGLELAADLRAQRPSMPIAVITANIQDEIVAQARALNAAFIIKPLTEDGLRGFVTGAALRLRALSQ
jgi:CheY-like chemotaxis protein